MMDMYNHLTLLGIVTIMQALTSNALHLQTLASKHPQVSNKMISKNNTGVWWALKETNTIDLRLVFL